jgi:ribonuclease HI
MAKKSKFYAVWSGREKGIFTSWDECKKQVDGFDGAQYKSFETLQEAQAAIERNYFSVVVPKNNTTKTPPLFTKKPNIEALIVDAAWNTKTGDMEYQGFELHTKKLLFKKGPFADGTNNIGEFLAIVHAIALLKKHGSTLPIYSDSRTAISWVRNKKPNTKLERTSQNSVLFELLARAEKWLNENSFPNKILKWETKIWGENPADFGRK